MIYKKDSKGKIRTWDAEIKGDHYRILTGIMGGKVVASTWKTAKAKNVGRTNETSATQQAIIEVEATRRKKLSVDYHESLDDVDTQKVFLPMLATKFVERRGKLDWNQTYIAQPKLDGIRMLATAQGLFSRKGKPFATMPHIEEALAPVFRQNPDLILDGELYNHDLGDEFEQFVSIVKRGKQSAEQLQQARELIQYHVYDVAQGISGGYCERHEALKRLLSMSVFNNCIQQLGYSKVHSESDLMSMVDDEIQLKGIGMEHVENGYEGTMIRVDQYDYEAGKRSNSLMKLKVFDDDEFEILGFLPGSGNWSGTAKTARIKLNDGSEGIATMTGNHEYLKSIWENPTPLIGKMATVKYFGFTAYDQLRHPTLQTIHHTERL